MCIRGMSTHPYGSLPSGLWEHSYLDASEKFIEVDGMAVNYVAVGQGAPTVLLLHGIGASYRIWQTALPLLSRLRRVVAIDLPGFGASSPAPGNFGATEAAGHIDRICEFLGLGTVDVVGHSMGGMLAMQLAYSHPERVGRLALISAGLTSIMKFYRHPLATVIAEPAICARFVTQVMVATVAVPPSVVRYVVEQPRLRKLACRDYLADAERVDGDLLLDVLLSCGGPSTLLAAMMGFRFDFMEVAEAMTRRPERALLVAGARDRFTAANDAMAFGRLIGSGDLITIPETGHWPMIERPQALNCVLRAWLDD